MLDGKAFYKMSYGLYLLSAQWEGKDNGCIVDAVMQSASEPKHITISCMKQNLTPELIAKSGEFTLSILTKDTPDEFFRHFGMQTGRKTDKFDGFEGVARAENGRYYATEANAYFCCKVIQEQDLGSHYQFTAVVERAQVLSDALSITYAEYRERMRKGATAAASARPSAPKAEVKTMNADNGADKKAPEKGGSTMKWVCKVCGYIYEGAEPPAECPVCHQPASAFEKVEGELKLAAEHEYGIYAKTVKNNPDISDEDKAYIFEQLKANFMGECSEVGMYLCMARIAHREGYPEIGLYWEKAAFEEAEHAAKFAELLGEDLEPNMKATTKDNLAWRVDCEFGATAGKFELASCAKKNNLDAIHDTVHEMARDEARHGKALKGLLERYF